MEPDRIHVLLIEDAPKFAGLIQDLLEKVRGGFRLDLVASIRDGLAFLEKRGADVVLLDLSLGAGQAGPGGKEEFEKLRDNCDHAPIIVLSSQHDETLALRAVQEGAQDYLVKDLINPPLLIRSIRYAIERKRAEMAALRAEEKYRSIFQHSVEGIFQTTADGHYLSANPALARIYGYPSPDALIAELTDIAHQLYLEEGRREEFIRLMEQNDVVTDFESKIRRKDGSVIWISENVRAVRDEWRRLLYYEGTVENITERRKSEELLRNSEALYHSLVEHLPQNIFRKDLNERFTFANQRFCQTLGRPLSEILGKTDFDFFPPELAEKYQEDDRLILESGQVFETVEEHIPPGGGKLYVNVSKTPLYDAQGKIIGLQGIFWDITARRRAEEGLRRTTLELAKSREELRIKNEQMKEDLRMAGEIQRAIIPQEYPSFPQAARPEDSLLRFSHRYLPTGQVGGDFFNVHALSDTKAGVFICDVMGHGVQSALVTGIIRALVEELRDLATQPGRLLGQINQDLRAILRRTGTPMFTTAFYMIADLEQNLLSFTNAGHPRPLLIRRATQEVLPLANAAGKCFPALGLFEGSNYLTSHLALRPGDHVMLYTDGLYDVEGKNQDQINPEWLQREVQQFAQLPAGDLFDALLAEIGRRSENAGFADDVCLVGMEFLHPAAAAPN